MHHTLGSFATRKPGFWCQKDEDQNDNTQKIPLPGVSRVVPEEDLLKCGEQASHVLKLASMQPHGAVAGGSKGILTHSHPCTGV